MQDFLFIDIPDFIPEYKIEKKYGYTKPDEKENMKKVLSVASKGYCMYCYARIDVDGKNYGNLEHAIEKNNSRKLIECIPDIGISCTVCNQSFKRIGERKRKLSQSILDRFNKNSECGGENRKQCKVPCKALRDLQKEYSKQEGAEIILQPMGVVGTDSGKKLKLRYNVMKMEFQPAKQDYTYSKKEMDFINGHIQRFRLNDPQYKTRQLYNFVKSVIDNEGVLNEMEYNNLIVEIFAEKIKYKDKTEILKICNSIYITSFLNM